MNADGTGQMNLTRTPGDEDSPSWSPDGKRIVFMALRGRNNDIYVMNADGSGQIRLTTDPDPDGDPAWSP